MANLNDPTKPATKLIPAHKIQGTEVHRPQGHVAPSRTLPDKARRYRLAC